MIQKSSVIAARSVGLKGKVLCVRPLTMAAPAHNPRPIHALARPEGRGERGGEGSEPHFVVDA